MNKPTSNAQEKRDFYEKEVAVNTCENCGQTCDRLYPVPEFEYMGCETCRDEAEAIMAADPLPTPQCNERVGTVLVATSVDELRYLLRAHEAQCAFCGAAKKQADRELLAAAGCTSEEAAAFLRQREVA